MIFKFDVFCYVMDMMIIIQTYSIILVRILSAFLLIFLLLLLLLRLGLPWLILLFLLLLIRFVLLFWLFFLLFLLQMLILYFLWFLIFYLIRMALHFRFRDDFRGRCRYMSFHHDIQKFLDILSSFLLFLFPFSSIFTWRAWFSLNLLAFLIVLLLCRLGLGCLRSRE